MIELAVAVLGIFVAAIIGGLVFVDWSPKLSLNITHQWVDHQERTCIVRLEVTNLSRVPVIKAFCRFQMLEHSISAQPNLREGVPFSVEYMQEQKPEDHPLAWQKPEEVLLSTSCLYPGETITVERLVAIANPNRYLHVALQFRGSMRWLSRTALRFWGIRRSVDFKRHEQWTTTSIIYPPKLLHHPSP